jgi:hypothetical protein
MEAASFSQSTHRRPDPGKVYPMLSLVLALAAGLALRVWMFNHFFDVEGDSLVYGDLAKNLLLHGQYAESLGGGELHSTLIRLPGYPLFLALCFRLFGMENYASASFVQIVLDLLGCVLLAGFVRRVAPAKFKSGAAHCTLWLAALCPFTAIFAVMPLAEGPTLFFLALALWSTARFLDHPGWSPALWFTFAVTSVTLLRPDGALAAVALAPALLLGLRATQPAKQPARMEGAGFSPYINSPKLAGALAPEGRSSSVLHESGVFVASHKRTGTALPRPRLLRMALVCTLLALLPFAAWAWRNWQVFHVVQPLAPRLATDPGADTHPGWEAWVKSWCLDFVSTYDIYWNVPGGPLDLAKLPARAFDSPAQYAQTAALAAEYNSSGQELSPAIDAQFAQLAAERTAAHPLRTWLWLPLGRVADMWLRPRVENLPIDLDWWVYARHNDETRFSWEYAGLNALYLLLALAGLCLRPRLWAAMLAYMLLRSALLLTVEAPETRYTIECFPMLFALAGIALYRLMNWVRLSVLNLNASPGSD